MDKNITIVSGNSKEQVFRWVWKLQKNAKNASNLKVVQSFPDLPFNEQDFLKKSGVYITEGVYATQKNTIYLIADHIRNQKEAVLTWIHEQGMHNGLRQLFGESFDNLIKSMQKTLDRQNPNYIDNFVQKWGLDLDPKDPTGRLVATEEILAYAGHMSFNSKGKTNLDDVQVSLLEKFSYWLKKTLVKHDIQVEFKDKEVSLLLKDTLKNVFGKKKETLSETVSGAIKDNQYPENKDRLSPR